MSTKKRSTCPSRRVAATGKCATTGVFLKTGGQAALGLAVGAAHLESRRGRPRLARCGGGPFRSVILLFVTQTLDAAIAKLETLPPEEQDRVGHGLLDELRDDEHWAHQFRASQDALSKLAAEARADRNAGRTSVLDPEHM